MTDLEQRSYEVLLEVMEFFAAGRKIPNHTYMEVMGHIRNMATILERHKAGCPTGMHFNRCTCKPAVAGRVIDNRGGQLK